MSKALIEKLQRAREFNVKVGERTFTVRRPTDAEALEMQGEAALGFVKRFVCGWDLGEIDIVPGGTPEKVPFTRALWEEWIVDQPDLWEPLGMAVVDAYLKHTQQRGEAEKN